MDSGDGNQVLHLEIGHIRKDFDKYCYFGKKQ